MEAGFALEPLAGEAVGGEGSGRHMHSAEGVVGGGPDLYARRVRRKHWPADVVSVDEGDHAAFDDRDRGSGGPEVVADQGGGGVVVLGGAANRGWSGGGPRSAQGRERREGTRGRLLRSQGGRIHGGHV